MNLREACDKLAAKIAEEAVENGRNFQERVDAMKALSTYFSATQRAKPPVEAPVGRTFGHFEALLRETGADGAQEVPDDDSTAGSAARREAGVRAGAGPAFGGRANGAG